MSKIDKLRELWAKSRDPEEHEPDPRYVFQLSKKQARMFDEWAAQHRQQHTGAIGGRYEFSFFSTSVGRIIKVTDCLTKEVLDLSCYEDW